VLIIERGGSVRLVKGAFADARPHVFRSRAKIDETYLALVRTMLGVAAKARGFRPVSGTHDDALIAEIRRVAKSGGWHPGAYEARCCTACAPSCRSSCARKASRCGSICRSAATGGPTPSAASAKARATPRCWRALVSG
jgi:proline dehydrogenase